MAKQALGRNLGALLDSGAKENGTVPGNSTGATTPLGAGVHSLVRGHRPAEAGAAVESPESAVDKATVIPGWYLFGGDILLTALALLIVATSPHPLSWERELFCAVAVILGAGSAMAAVLLADDKKRAEPSRTGTGVMAHRETPEKF